MGHGHRDMVSTPCPHAPCPVPRAPNPVPRTPYPVPRTPNPEPRTPNPEPRTPNPVPLLQGFRHRRFDILVRADAGVYDFPLTIDDYDVRRRRSLIGIRGVALPVIHDVVRHVVLVAVGLDAINALIE